VAAGGRFLRRNRGLDPDRRVALFPEVAGDVAAWGDEVLLVMKTTTTSSSGTRKTTVVPPMALPPATTRW
jgi:hypothetical protein